VGFEPTTPVLERVKAVLLALDLAPTEVGNVKQILVCSGLKIRNNDDTPLI
jgi:hypothetical protein